MAEITQAQYRQAVGQFATGVCVVTAADPQGGPVGMTVNSFTSVSLDPLQILWCAGNQAPEFAAFEAAQYFAVHVLAEQQTGLSNRFATSGADKFAELEAVQSSLEWSDNGVPMLGNTLVRLQCKAVQQHLSGDHLIIVGEVQALDPADAENTDPPLVFHAGQYTALR